MLPTLFIDIISFPLDEGNEKKERNQTKVMVLYRMVKASTKGDVFVTMKMKLESQNLITVLRFHGPFFLLRHSINCKFFLISSKMGPLWTNAVW